jgi:hypothetical protein
MISRLGIDNKVMAFVISAYPMNFIIGLVRANFAYPDIARNIRRRFSYLGLPNSPPIDGGLVNAPVVLLTNASRRASSRAGHLNRTCVLVVFGGPGSSPRYIS